MVVVIYPQGVYFTQRLKTTADPAGSEFEMSTQTELTYVVNGMTCGHCEAAVKEEVGELAGVSGVEVDLGTKIVRVTGEALDDTAVRAAIDEAGYEAELA